MTMLRLIAVLATLQLVHAVPAAGAVPCAVKDFSGHHCHISMSNLTSPKITTPVECGAAVCAAGGGLDTSQWCATGAGCSPVGCYGATVSKQASCPRTHGWVTSLVNYKKKPAPSPAPGMTHMTLAKATADKFGAKCLQGTPPSYELRLNASSDKWVLFLEGGGWCYGLTPNATVVACAHRAMAQAQAETARVSEAEAGRPTADYGGVMSSDPSVNPDFHGWNAAFIHYCDGASFGSNSAEPVPIPGESIPASRRRDCHFADVPSMSLLEHLLQGEGEGCAAE